jgi:hypothetical protein
VLRVALADDEADDRGRDPPVLGALVDQAGLDEAVEVGLERERDDVGLLAGLDGAALVTGRAEGGLEGRAAARLGLLELRDDLVVDDLGGRVGDEGKLLI